MKSCHTLSLLIITLLGELICLQRTLHRKELCELMTMSELNRVNLEVLEFDISRSC